MRKRILAILPIVVVVTAMFSFLAASPASAASYHATVRTTPNDNVTICFYKVTATAGLNARSGVGTDSDDPIQYTMPFGTIVAAYRDVVTTTTDPDTHTWRELADGNWSATQWLQKTTQTCVA
jgi:hypothetical protein